MTLVAYRVKTLTGRQDVPSPCLHLASLLMVAFLLLLLLFLLLLLLLLLLGSDGRVRAFARHETETGEVFSVSCIWHPESPASNSETV